MVHRVVVDVIDDVGSAIVAHASGAWNGITTCILLLLGKPRDCNGFVCSTLLLATPIGGTASLVPPYDT